MREAGTATVVGAPAQVDAGRAPERWERLGPVRPRAVWRGLSPAAQARIRQTFVRVLLEALGATPRLREVGGDASSR